MEAQKVDMFIMTNGKFFESHHLPALRERLLELDDSKWPILQTLQFKDPNIILVVSLVAGAFGVDRFLLGDVGLGVAKLVTCGGFGIWAIVDWFLVMGAARERNLETVQRIFF